MEEKGFGRDRVLWIAVAFAVVATALGLLGVVDSDEGLFTYLGVEMTADSPAASLFFQKVHPALSLLYLPTAALGWHSFVVAHVLLAALGVLAIGRWADRLGGDGWIASLTVALSPAYAFSACTGQSNSDGIALIALGLWLFESDGHRRRFAAGLVLGLTVWARYEFAAFVGVLGLVALFRPGRRAPVLGMMVFPLAYLIGGAVYHHAALWFLQNPPMEADPAPGLREVYRRPASLATVRQFLGAYALVSGAWALLFTPAAYSRSGSARAVVGVGAGLLVLFTVTPFFGIDGPDIVPRYLSVALPAIAFAASRARSLALPRALGAPYALLAAAWLGTLLWLADAHQTGPVTALVLVSALVIAGPAVLLWSRVEHRVRVLVGLPLLSALVVLALPEPSWRDQEPWHDQSREAAAVLRAAAASHPSIVVTDIQSLVPRLHRAGLRSARYLFAYDIVLGLDTLASHRNGQFESAARGFRDHYELGGALWPCDLARREFRAGDLVVLGDDFRTGALVPASVWEADTERVAVAGRATIRRFVRGPVRVRLPPPPSWMSPRVFEAACR